MYMNECMKLQNLLKVYGAANLKKQFKGVKITQNYADSSRRVERNRSKSPKNKEIREQMQIEQLLDSAKKKPSTSNQKTPSEGLTGAFPPIKDGTGPIQPVGGDTLAVIEELQ